MDRPGVQKAVSYQRAHEAERTRLESESEVRRPDGLWGIGEGFSDFSENAPDFLCLFLREVPMVIMTYVRAHGSEKQ